MGEYLSFQEGTVFSHYELHLMCTEFLIIRSAIVVSEEHVRLLKDLKLILVWQGQILDSD